MCLKNLSNNETFSLMRQEWILSKERKLGIHSPLSYIDGFEFPFLSILRLFHVSVLIIFFGI